MIQLKPPQWQVFRSDARFRVLVAGRRFGKTFLSLVELCQAAWSKPNETYLRIELNSGGTICLRGADNYDSLRGDGLDFLILDEYASIAREAWPEVLRPALADKQGRALFIGTPRGYNHFYELYQGAEGKPDWATFQFTTKEGGNVSHQELVSATHELDERTYKQEFQASFENLTAGRVYYAFDRDKNVEPQCYNPGLPLFWSLDFNINPICSVIGQRDGNEVHILDEMALPDSNTEAACRAFVEKMASLRPHSIYAPELHIYGDATGSSRKTSASRTDWQIVENFFNHQFCKISRKVPSSNPPVKDRVNCVWQSGSLDPQRPLAAEAVPTPHRSRWAVSGWPARLDRCSAARKHGGGGELDKWLRVTSNSRMMKQRTR